MLPELFELGVHRALVFLDIRTGEVVLGGAVGVAFDLQVIVGDVPLGRYSTSQVGMIAVGATVLSSRVLRSIHRRVAADSGLGAILPSGRFVSW